MTVEEAIEQLKTLPRDSQITVPGKIILVDGKWVPSWIGAEEIKADDNKVRIW